MGELKVICESLEDRPDDVLKAIEKDLLDAVEIRVRAERIAMGAIERSDYKSKKFIDKREK